MAANGLTRVYFVAMGWVIAVDPVCEKSWSNNPQKLFVGTSLNCGNSGKNRQVKRRPIVLAIVVFHICAL